MPLGLENTLSIGNFTDINQYLVSLKNVRAENFKRKTK